MKVILTGSDGFIGKNLKKQLEKVWEVVEVEKNDCWLFLDAFEDWDDVECIFHMGAISDTTSKDPMMVNLFNVKFTLSLFMIAAQKGIPVKYASSASVYGNSFNASFNPLNYYALSKLTVDYWVEDHMSEFSHIQGFRFFNVYGQGEEDKIARNQSSPISKFIHEASTNGKIRIFENSEEFMRDFVYVGDVINVMLDNKKSSGIYDLGTSKPISFQEVAEIIAERHCVNIEYIPFPEHLKGKYQVFTCAELNWDYDFITVEDYVRGTYRMGEWLF